MQHAGEDEGGGDAGVAGREAEVLEGVGEAQFAEGVEGEAFGPDGAHEAVVEGVEVDEGEVVIGSVRQGGEAEAVGDLLGGAEQVGIGLEEGGLAGADGLDQIAEGGPECGGHREVSAEVEQGDLADGVAGADAADQAAGGVGFGAVAGAGLDAADEHGALSMARAKANMQATISEQNDFMSLQTAIRL